MESARRQDLNHAPFTGSRAAVAPKAVVEFAARCQPGDERAVTLLALVENPADDDLSASGNRDGSTDKTRLGDAGDIEADHAAARPSRSAKRVIRAASGLESPDDCAGTEDGRRRFETRPHENDLGIVLYGNGPDELGSGRVDDAAIAECRI